MNGSTNIEGAVQDILTTMEEYRAQIRTLLGQVRESSLCVQALVREREASRSYIVKLEQTLAKTEGELQSITQIAKTCAGEHKLDLPECDLDLQEKFMRDILASSMYNELQDKLEKALDLLDKKCGESASTSANVRKRKIKGATDRIVYLKLVKDLLIPLLAAKLPADGLTRAVYDKNICRIRKRDKR